MTETDLLQSALDELDLDMVLAAVSRFAISDLGKEATKTLRPGTDPTSVRLDLDRVQDCVDLIAAGLRLPFDKLDDVRDLMKKSRIEGNFLSAPDLLNVLEAMQTSRLLKSFFDEQADQAPSLHTLAIDLLDERVLEKHILDAIDETGLVRDDASRELRAIRKEIHELQARLRSRLQRILKKFGEEEILQDEFITQRDGRFVLPLRVSDKRSVEGIIHGVSSTGQTVFLEPAETYEMNNDLSLLRGREQREIIKILTTLTAEVSTVSHHLEAAVDVMTKIDTVIARARYALEFGGIKPTIVDDMEIELTNVRHPVLVQQGRVRRDLKEKVEEVVPLSVRLDDTTRGLLISGPNAGGKTVAMKTIGVSLAMAMSGIFPLGTCTTNLRRLYAAIGDHQSIDSNLSTFSSQIIRLRDILSFCDKEALVLIDEICAGTDPAEGGALAAGILDSLIERGASFVVTTHQSSLKQYALTRPTITNASLAFDEERLLPTFNFLYGVPGNSYAFDLARNVGLPAIVIDRGKGYLGERHDELEESISAMQRYQQEAERLKREAAAERLKAEQIRKDYEERLEQVKKRRTTVVSSAKEEAEELLKNANALIENTIREIREDKKSAKELKEEFVAAKEALLKTEDRGPKSVDRGPKTEGRGPKTDDQGTGHPAPGTLQKGDVVVVTGTSSEGTVLETDHKNGLIDVNGMKFRVPLKQLTLIARSGTKEADSRTVHATRDPNEPLLKPDPGMTLDMRGMRADEGLRALEEFLDQGIVSALPFATIIHGKGTGALRKVVHDYLSDHHAITSWRPGEMHEGGDGVTIITF
jgi:DNA mismatch repair protein MutS2